MGHCRQVGCPQNGVQEATRRLLTAGHKVGIIEQLETAAEAKSKRGLQVTTTARPSACIALEDSCLKFERQISEISAVR